MYGSSLRSVTLMPRDSRIAAREAAAIPFPKEETTPPDTNTYLAITNQGDGMENGTGHRPPAQFQKLVLSELGAVPEMLERLGVGERFDVLHRAAVHHVSHRQLDDLVRLGARDVRHLEYFGGHMARRGVLAYAPLDPGDQTFVERQALAQLHEQHHAHVADLPGRPGLPDDERLHNLVELLDLAVDLGGPDAHAARVEHGIGAAVDDHPAVGCDLAPVAVRPYARKPLEVGGAVFLPAGVAKEPDGQRGKRPSADELALLAFDRTPALVEHLDLEAERAFDRRRE